MKLLMAFLSLCLIVLLSCHQPKSGTTEYGRLSFDTARIAIFQWDTSNYFFPKNSDPLPLMQNDLSVIDSFLTDAIDSFNVRTSAWVYRSFDKKISLDRFLLHKEKYQYQFFPYKDVNGERIVAIIGFSINFPGWKSEVYRATGHFGISKIELKVNLSEKIRDDISTGGYG